MLEGSVLDLGGGARAEYHRFFPNAKFTTVNIDEETKPDIVHDLEEPLPFANASYDHALLINVLEHVYGARELLRETARVVRPGGSAVIVVPFLFPLHPSPRDFWRWSEEALRRECEAAGLSVERATALGGGVFSARYVMLDRLLPSVLRLVGSYSVRYAALFADILFASLARSLGKKYRPSDYALGYCLVAKK
jgi:SAM-dependent methyltransferase